MKFKFLTIGLCLSLLSGCASAIHNAEMDFQNDADVVRVNHLSYWTGLIEEYHDKTGIYPFEDSVGDEVGMVRIMTPEQYEYARKDSRKYRADLDNNKSRRFIEIYTNEFVAELESVLGEIDEKYDIQKVPYMNPIGYYYFVEEGGYGMWVTCVTCEISPISTKLMYGNYVPTVNIAAGTVKGKLFKSLSREDMINNPRFKKWTSREMNKPEYINKLVESNHNASERWEIK